MQSSKPLQGKQKRMKNKECSLYGIFILKKVHGQNPENFQKLRYFAMYLQSPEYIAKNSTFRQTVQGLLPQEMGKSNSSKWALAQVMHTQLETDDAGLPTKDPRKNHSVLFEVRMYSDRVDNKLGVTIKTCNRLKGIEDNQVTFRNFIEDSGFTQNYKHRKQGYFFQYLMNDYEDLRAMIPPEKQHIKYKANLLIFSYFRQERNEYKDVNILQQYFHVDSQEEILPDQTEEAQLNQNFLANFDGKFIEISGFCTDEDQVICSRLLLQFAKKFSQQHHCLQRHITMFYQILYSKASQAEFFDMIKQNSKIKCNDQVQVSVHLCVKDLFMFLIIIKLKMKREGGLKKKKDAVQGLPKGQNIGDYWRMNPKKYYLKQTILLFLELGFLAVAVAFIALEADKQCLEEDGDPVKEEFYKATALVLAGHLFQVIKLIYYMYRLKMPQNESVIKCCMQGTCCYYWGSYIYVQVVYFTHREICIQQLPLMTRWLLAEVVIFYGYFGVHIFSCCCVLCLMVKQHKEEQKRQEQEAKNKEKELDDSYDKVECQDQESNGEGEVQNNEDKAIINQEDENKNDKRV